MRTTWTEESPEGRRGSAYALWNLAFSLGYLVGPAAGAYVTELAANGGAPMGAAKESPMRRRLEAEARRADLEVEAWLAEDPEAVRFVEALPAAGSG